MSCKHTFPLIRCMRVQQETTVQPEARWARRSCMSWNHCKWDQAENKDLTGTITILMTLLMIACFTCDHFRLVCDPRIVKHIHHHEPEPFFATEWDGSKSFGQVLERRPTKHKMFRLASAFRSFFTGVRKLSHIYKYAMLMTCANLGKYLVIVPRTLRTVNFLPSRLSASLCAAETATLGKEPR